MRLGLWLIVFTGVQELDQSLHDSGRVAVQGNVASLGLLVEKLETHTHTRERSQDMTCKYFTSNSPSTAARMTSDWPTTTALCTLKISPLQEKVKSLYWPVFIIRMSVESRSEAAMSAT